MWYNKYVGCAKAWACRLAGPRFLVCIEESLRQYCTIPALRLKHRSGGCGTASALPKCSIMSGCGTRIVLRFAVSATGGAHLCSIQYYLRVWLGICRTSLAVSALRIMRYCLYYSIECSKMVLAYTKKYRFLAKKSDSWVQLASKERE